MSSYTELAKAVSTKIIQHIERRAAGRRKYYKEQPAYSPLPSHLMDRLSLFLQNPRFGK
jgi:hypothetical protein